MIWKIFTITMVVFLFNLATASAVNINLIKDGDTERIIYDTKKFFNRSITEINDTINVKILPVNNGSISNIQLYLCRDRNPIECLDQDPIEYRKFVNSDFLKTDFYKNGKGNMLAFLETGRTWLADWYPSQDYNLDLDLNANINDTKEMIEEGIIPYSFVKDFRFFGNVYQLTGIPIENRRTKKKYINFTHKELVSQVKDIKGYSFVFPDSGVPLTIYNQEEKCGNAVCELGENYDICWQDCRCPPGQAPTSNGCAPASNISLKIVNKSTDVIDCFPGNDRCSVVDKNFKVYLEMENAPQKYRLHKQFMYVGDKRSLDIICKPTDSKPKPEIVDGSFRRVYNSSKFECNPIFYIDIDEVGRKSLSIHFWISFDTQNGTETLDISGQTDIEIVNKIRDLQELLLESKKKIEEFKDDTKWIRELMTAFGKLRNIYTGIAAGTCACCGATLGACGCGACWEFSVATVVTELVKQSLKLASEYCVGKYGGTGNKWARQAVDVCREIGRAKDQLNQKIGEAQGKLNIELKNYIPNLLWVNGEHSGFAVNSVCGQERTEIWYSLEKFECDNKTWFNTNPESLMCNCTSGNYLNPSALSGNSCSCTNTSDYQWIVDRDVGEQVWNSTGIHILYNGSADQLFQNSNELNMTLYCNSERFGEIKETFKILEYNQTCSGLAASKVGINPFQGSL